VNAGLIGGDQQAWAERRAQAAAAHAQRKAEVAENTRIANERASAEAAKNESPFFGIDRTVAPNFDWGSAGDFKREWLGEWNWPMPGDAERRTGRTTRQLMECLDRAARGQTVVFVAVHRMVIETNLDLIEKHGRTAHRSMVVDRRLKEVTFPQSYHSKGSLTITHGHESLLIFRPIDVVVFDHAHPSAPKESPAIAGVGIDWGSEKAPDKRDWLGEWQSVEAKFLREMDAIDQRRRERDAPKPAPPDPPSRLFTPEQEQGFADYMTRKTTAPAPPAPKCAGALKEHGPLVERWRASLVKGASNKVLMCDGCYVHAERLLAEDEHARDMAGPLCSPGQAARTGLVPQSFGDQRIGGIWAARGMR
jgi:hypothetical protein